MKNITKHSVIVALDFGSEAEALDFLALFPEGEKPFVKVGMELFYSAGPEIVRRLKDRGHRVFLDLKLHDIPNTVKRTMAALRDLGADMVNMHAAGGSEMMRAAIEGLTRPDGTRPLAIAVTQLTSTSPRMLNEELLIGKSMDETVAGYAANAASAGLDGVVCSPLEAAEVKARCGEDFLTVTPGIRFADGAADDQKRIMAPADAATAGCDFIVVGRPITKAADPLAAYRRACKEFGAMPQENGHDGAKSAAVDSGKEPSAIDMARDLLDIGAVFLRPENPFTWASGIKSPIYCDNRLTLTAPTVRTRVENGLVALIRRHYPNAEVLMGTSTAGIAHAAICGHIMGLPMGYVRSGSKDHGRQNRIEGRLLPGQKTVVVEDLISTGGSSIEVVEALRDAGANVLGIVSIFTYNLAKSVERLAAANVENHSLSCFEAVCEAAAESGTIAPEDIERLRRFQRDPSDPGWMA